MPDAAGAPSDAREPVPARPSCPLKPVGRGPYPGAGPRAPGTRAPVHCGAPHDRPQQVSARPPWRPVQSGAGRPRRAWYGRRTAGQVLAAPGAPVRPGLLLPGGERGQLGGRHMLGYRLGSRCAQRRLPAVEGVPAPYDTGRGPGHHRVVGHLPRTTAPAATTTLRPSRAPGEITAPVPSQQPGPMLDRGRAGPLPAYGLVRVVVAVVRRGDVDARGRRTCRHRSRPARPRRRVAAAPQDDAVAERHHRIGAQVQPGEHPGAERDLLADDAALPSSIHCSPNTAPWGKAQLRARADAPEIRSGPGRSAVTAPVSCTHRQPRCTARDRECGGARRRASRRRTRFCSWAPGHRNGPDHRWSGHGVVMFAPPQERHGGWHTVRSGATRWREHEELRPTMTERPLIAAVGGKEPQVDEGAYAAPTSVVVGEVTLARGASVWYHAVLRADCGPITLGENSNIQDNCTVHVDPGIPGHGGRGVSVGHNAVLHGCTVETDVAGRHGEPRSSTAPTSVRAPDRRAGSGPAGRCGSRPGRWWQCRPGSSGS